MPTYYWDFFGPMADGTARHFERHLREFLGKHGITGCDTGTCSEQPNHRAAYCRAPEEAAAVIERALRPRRKV